jgi:hypothetical protein
VSQILYYIIMYFLFCLFSSFTFSEPLDKVVLVKGPGEGLKAASFLETSEWRSLGWSSWLQPLAESCSALDCAPSQLWHLWFPHEDYQAKFCNCIWSGLKGHLGFRLRVRVSFWWLLKHKQIIHCINRSQDDYYNR